MERIQRGRLELEVHGNGYRRSAQIISRACDQVLCRSALQKHWQFVFGLLGLVLPLDNFLCYHSEGFLCIAIRQQFKDLACFRGIRLGELTGPSDAF